MNRSNGMEKRAFKYDALSVSNRTDKSDYENLNANESNYMNDLISKVSSTVNEQDFEKQASFSNGLEMFTGVRKMISNKLGISEGVAQEMTSNVITKSDKIVKEYGGDQMSVSSNIIEEMKSQIAENPEMLKEKVNIHPMRSNGGKLKERIKTRLIQELMLSQRDAEMYKDLIYRQSQDITTVLRPHKTGDIAMGIVDIVKSSGDLTSVYGFKDSPMLMSSLRIQLGE